MNKDSGYESPSDKRPIAASADNSLEEDESDSFSNKATATSFASPVNPQDSTAGSSSSTKRKKEEETNFRSAEETMLCKVSFLGYSTLGTTLCQSTGRETILDMINNRLATSKKTTSGKFILFTTENDECLNLGLPVGKLFTMKNYRCEFKRSISDGRLLQASDYMREYAVNEYSSNWNLRHFFVSLSNDSATVSPFKKFTNVNRSILLQVHFFRNETILEALVRDNRFFKEKLKCCVVHCERTQIPMSYKAFDFRKKIIYIYLQKEILHSIESIQPRPHPDLLTTSVKVEPASKVKTEKDSVVTAEKDDTAGSNTVDSSTSWTAWKSSTANSVETFTQLIEYAFKSENIPSKTIKALTKACDSRWRNFALGQNLSVPACQVRDLAKILDAVGAIFKLNYAGFPELVGTCFGTGTQYILTNYHVYNFVAAAMENVFIDFDFEEGETPKPSGRRYMLDSHLVYSEDLDYAILKLTGAQLPAPCIFSAGVTIMDPSNSNCSMLEGHCVQLIGHPNGQPKLVDPMCPVDTTPQDSLAIYSYALRRGLNEEQARNAYLNSKDPKRVMYHVSSFFYGSSGSPGILFLNGKKVLVLVHTRGLHLKDPNRTAIEQGVLFTEIIKHVKSCIENAHQEPYVQNFKLLPRVKLSDIFPGVDYAWPELMNVAGLEV